MKTQNRVTSYAQLEKLASERASRLQPRSLVAVTDHPREAIIDQLSAYIACSLAGACAMLLPSDSADGALSAAYAPDTVAAHGSWTMRPPGSAVEPALLLSTSGTTASKKFVKLSRESVEANCAAIARSLPIEPTDTAMLLLSPSYSYGLSVVNTHLSCGASLYVPAVTSLTKALWAEARAARVTSIAFVPSHLEALSHQRFEEQLPRQLRYVTVAGGRVTKGARAALDRFRAVSVRAYVMYGQTEATARITCLQDSEYDSFPESVGCAIDGSLEISSDGEVVYTGPNVFSGYASCRADLLDTSSDRTLHTGDLGQLNDSGHLWITGRLKRIAKVNSQRTNLDELEQQLEEKMGTPVKCTSDDTWIYVHVEGAGERLAFSSADVNGQSTIVKLHTVASFPLLPNGKTDYATLGAVHAPT